MADEEPPIRFYSIQLSPEGVEARRAYNEKRRGMTAEERAKEIRKKRREERGKGCFAWLKIR